MQVGRQVPAQPLKIGTQPYVAAKVRSKDKKQPSEIPYRHFLRGRCNLGDKRKFSHKGKPKVTNGNNGDGKNNPLNRCKADLNDKNAHSEWNAGMRTDPV